MVSIMNVQRLRPALFAGFLALGMPAPGVAQGQGPSPLSVPPFAWWKAEGFSRDLGLTSEQAARVDKIWEATRPELRKEWDELSQLEKKLSTMLQNDADEAVLSRQIDRVETARANASKTRTLMLVQMLKVLTPAQRVRFSELHARWRDEHRRAPDDDRRRR